MFASSTSTPALREAENRPTEKIIDTFRARRVTPVQLNNQRWKAVQINGLGGCYLGVSLTDGTNQLVATIIVQVDASEDKAGVIDAVILLPEETPEVFFASNIRFAVSSDDMEKYVKMVANAFIQRLTVIGKAQGSTICESEDRLLLFADNILTYFSLVPSQRLRGVDFVNAVLPRHVAALRWYMLTSKPHNLRSALKVLDTYQPLSILQHDDVFAKVDRGVVKEYIKIVISARERSASSDDADSRRLLDRDRAMLRQL